MDGKDPLGYPLSQYLWVIGIACIAGLIKHLNSMRQFRFGAILIDLITAGFTGVIAFWICEARGIEGNMSAVLIAIAGAMGNRCWKEFETIWRIKLGLTKSDDEASK